MRLDLALRLGGGGEVILLSVPAVGDKIPGKWWMCSRLLFFFFFFVERAKSREKMGKQWCF